MTNTAFQEHPFDITTIDTGFCRPQFAASHLVVEGKRAALIDVGTTHSIPLLLNALHAKNVPVENVDYVIVTHIHLDHAGGAGKLMQALPNARLVVHPRGARHLVEPSQLIKGVIGVYGEATFHSNYGEIVPVAEERVIAAHDETVLELNGRPLLFLDTPGHAKHHFCIFDEKSKSFFTGDTFGLAYQYFNTQDLFIFASSTPVQFEPLPLHNSINRLLSYHPKQMYLTHYGQVTDVEKNADKLHDCIDILVTLTESVSEEGEQRQELLTEKILAYFLQELKQRGCPLPIATCREILLMDAQLNAQGLLIWWDRN